MSGYRTMIYPAWGNVPAKYRSDCMERIAPGLFRHLRLGVVFVIEQDINEQHADTLEHIEADLRHGQRSLTPDLSRYSDHHGGPVERTADDILFERLGR